MHCMNNDRYHWYIEGNGNICMSWLMNNYFLSCKDYVLPEVYKKIRKAFDAMVDELKWVYDKKRCVA